MSIFVDFTTWDFSWISWIGFRIITILYFIGFGAINIYYAFLSKNHPEKKGNKKYFINEVATGGLFLMLAALHPFLWNAIAPNEWVKDQLYFHLWDTLTWQLIGCTIYIFFARRNNIKKKRTISYEDWKKIQIEKYNAIDQTSLKADVKRKLQHLLPGATIIGFYYLAIAFQDKLYAINWTIMTGTLYFTAAIGITFALLMNIFDLLRLMKWDYLGKFARTWADGALHPNELNTVTSAAIMVLAFVPFFILPEKQFLFAVCLIAGIADAMACIIGKKFGSIRSKKTNKTLEGYLAGSISTYLLVLLTNLMIPFGVSIYGVHLIALSAAIGFFCVDYFSKYLSDNILNSFVCGSLMYLTFLLIR
ncbi:MAG: hypothetical protein ACTSO2_12225 [Promethearchaeota archaeon]